ncbi:MAG: hypothetical protein AB7G28_06645 [Pirellulales bacterium]
MNSSIARRQLLFWAAQTLALSLLGADRATATVYDFEPDGGEYAGNILGQNPLFVPGGIRSITQFNNLYKTSNNSLIHDEFEVGAGNPIDFRLSTGYMTNWENGSPVITNWINSRAGFKFPAGSALGGEYSGGRTGEKITFRAYGTRVGSGLYSEMEELPVVAETSVVVQSDSQSLPFRFDSLSADAYSFAAIRTTVDDKFITSGIGMNTTSIEITTVPDPSPPVFRHSPTIFDFGNEGKSFAKNAYLLGETTGAAGLAKVNEAHASSHGFHNEEFEIGVPSGAVAGFRISGGSTAGYAGQWMSLEGSAGHVAFWVNAKEGNMFPEDAAIGVTRFNPVFTSFDNNGNPVEVIIRAYAERIESGSFEELNGLTMVGEAKGFGVGTFNTPPVLELLANARSFTVHTGDGNGNFYTFPKEGIYARTIVNQMIVDTVPDESAATPGDYNGDQVVNAADYTVWRDTLNSTTDLRADGNHSGTVDAGDYGVWKTNFGTAGGGGAISNSAVPEPQYLSMLALAAIALLLVPRFRFDNFATAMMIPARVGVGIPKMNGLTRWRSIGWGIGALCHSALLLPMSIATDYDFEPDGQEYAGDILGKNPLFFPGGIRNIKQFNDLYRTSNGFIVDEFEVGAGDPGGLGLSTGYYTTWEMDNPTIPTWVNSRAGFKFPAGSALGGEYTPAGAIGEKLVFRAYEFPIHTGLYTELDKLPYLDEVSTVIQANQVKIPFRIDSLSGDARSFAAFRVTADGKYITSPNPISVGSVELTTVADTSPPPFPRSPTQFDFANVGTHYPVDAFVVGDELQPGLDKLNAALDSSHGYHDEEFEFDVPSTGRFKVSGGNQNSYPRRWMLFAGSAGHVSWWVNAKDGYVFPEDAAIGVVNYNPGFTGFDNGGNPVEVIIRAYAEEIQTGTFEELAGLTLVGEAKKLGVGTFNTPPMLELFANAKSFTVHTGDGNGNFVTYVHGDGSFASTALNQIMIDTMPETPLGLPGDYNGDHTVDAADYTIYRDSVGQSTLNNRGPGITGPVGAADYDVWKAHFGDSSGGGANSPVEIAGVPEPCAWATLVLAALASTLSPTRVRAQGSLAQSNRIQCRM